MYESDLQVLRDKTARRILLELLAIGIGTAILLTTVIEPILLSQFPSVFPASPSPRQTGRFIRPTTRLGAVFGIITAGALGSFLYYRLNHTQLGKQFTSRFETEDTGSR